MSGLGPGVGRGRLGGPPRGPEHSPGWPAPSAAGVPLRTCVGSRGWHGRCARAPAASSCCRPTAASSPSPGPRFGKGLGAGAAAPTPVVGDRPGGGSWGAAKAQMAVAWVRCQWEMITGQTPDSRAWLGPSGGRPALARAPPGRQPALSADPNQYSWGENYAGSSGLMSASPGLCPAQRARSGTVSAGSGRRGLCPGTDFGAGGRRCVWLPFPPYRASCFWNIQQAARGPAARPPGVQQSRGRTRALGPTPACAQGPRLSRGLGAPTAASGPHTGRRSCTDSRSQRARPR